MTYRYHKKFMICKKAMDYKKQFDLSDRIAIVTGAAGLIGQEFALGLLQAGAKVALLDVDQDANNVLGSKLAGQFGPEKIMTVQCDVSNEASVQSAVDQVHGKWSVVDILCNNAATKSSDLNAFFAPFEEFSLSNFKEVMSVNVEGMALMAKAVSPTMLARKKGSIIQTASIYGVVGPDFRIYENSRYLNRAITTPAVYAASKGAVISLTKYLATYWGPKGIRVNSITPGGVESGQNDEFKTRYSAKVPMGRMAERSEMTGTMLYLASNASNYVTGQNMIIDGGFTAW
jgi:NAD(P)-dependent dehydrogenase (short-subunit alcohol dehydrogenase family)